MSKRQYKPQTEAKPVADSVSALPIDRPIAVYYRQSTDAQIGNVSTTIQTVDMVEYLKTRGWTDAKISMVDMDGGVSGTKKIDQRPGMKFLFDMITDGAVGAVACQDEDRLFRDVTQIQVNIFIEACKQSRVLVLTPSMVYDFAHPQLGSFHARQFRFKCEMAAEYITSYIQGRLHPAKHRRMMEGRWAGGTAPLGFMIDERKYLPDGSRNEDWRHYVVYEPHAKIVREYFRLFVDFAGNMSATIRHIVRHGPYFPDPKTWVAPEGFRFSPPRRMRNYGNGFCPGELGLQTLLTNAAYIGHWAVNDNIVRWNNHPAVVSQKVFMRAFNYLSDVTLDGEPNPHYTPFFHATRPSKDEQRPVARPLCAGMIFTEVNGKLKKAGTSYVSRFEHYGYYISEDYPVERLIWWKKADFVDEEVEQLLHDKWTATFASDVWEKTLTALAAEHGKESEFKQKELAALEETMANLVTSLETIVLPEMIKKVETRYAAAQAEYERLQRDIHRSSGEVARIEAIKALKEICGEKLEHWDELSRHQKRAIFHSFITRIEAIPVEKYVVRFVVHWNGGDQSEFTTGRKGATYKGWLPKEIKDLLALVETGATQIEYCSRFPARTWGQIREKINLLGGQGSVLIGAQPIKDIETYNDFLRRTGGAENYAARAGERWKQKDVDRLINLLDRGASQVEIAAAFPYRNWARLRAKITQLRGNVVIPGSAEVGKAGEIRKNETYEMYLRRKAGAKEPGENTAEDMGFQLHSGTIRHDAPA